MENIVKTEQLYEGKAKRYMQPTTPILLSLITRTMLPHLTARRKALF